MSEKQNPALLAITAQYVSESQAGLRPRLSDYLARYPLHAAEIADFVAYYHACEEPLTYPASSQAPGSFSQSSLTSLFAAASTCQLTPAQLAARLDLSLDLLSLLEQRAIASATIPQTLYLKLASLLQLPVGIVQAYFFSSRDLNSSHPAWHSQKVAEASGRYSPAIDERPTFRSILDASSELSPQQKAHWQTILAAEQGTETL